MLQKLLKLKRVTTRRAKWNILRLKGTLQNHESQTTLLLCFTLAVVFEQNLEKTDFTAHAFSISHTFFHQLLQPPNSLLVTNLAVGLGLALASVV